MEITVSRKELSAALGDCAGAVPSRTPKPILQNVLLTARGMLDGQPSGDGPASLQATDLEIGITRSFQASVKEGGTVVLPTDRIRGILSTSKADELTIRQDNEDEAARVLRVRAGRAKWDLPCDDPNLFPQVEPFGFAAYHVVMSHDLRGMIARTAFATDPESTRYALGGVLFQLDAAQIRLVGTDGRRLAESWAALETEGGPARYVNGVSLSTAKDATEQPSPVVPVRTLRLLEKLIRSDDAPVHIGIRPANAIMFRTGHAVVYSRIVEGRFPRYQDVYSASPADPVTLRVGPFLEALQSAAVTTSDETRGVDLTISPGLMTLKAQAADVGGSEVELEIPAESPSAVTTFDPHYLVEMLKVVGDDAEIRCEFREKEANLFQAGDNYKYVVMPLTRDR